MRKWKCLLPFSLMGCGLVIMMVTAFWANSSTRIASWPSVEIGPMRLIFFGGLEETISQEAETTDFLIPHNQKEDLTSHSFEIFQEATHHE